MVLPCFSRFLRKLYIEFMGSQLLLSVSQFCWLRAQVDETYANLGVVHCSRLALHHVEYIGA